MLGIFRRELAIVVQAGVSNIVVDPDRKVILGSGLLDFIEDSFRHRRSKFLRRETVAASDDPRAVCEAASFASLDSLNAVTTSR